MSKFERALQCGLSLPLSDPMDTIVTKNDRKKFSYCLTLQLERHSIMSEQFFVHLDEYCALPKFNAFFFERPIYLGLPSIFFIGLEP